MSSESSRTSRQREDFLVSTFTKKRDKGVDGVDHTNDVDVETGLKVFDQGLWIIRTAMRSYFQYHLTPRKHYWIMAYFANSQIS